MDHRGKRKQMGGEKVIKERVLKVGLRDIADLFDTIKWKFYEIEETSEEEGFVKVEVPRGSNESFVVELPYKSAESLRKIVDHLDGAGFIEQTIRTRCEY